MKNSPFENTTLFHAEKCEQCGANMNADCHAHAQYCTLSCKEDDDCNNPPNTPVGGGLVIMLLFVIIYFGVKQFRSNKKKPMSFEKYSSKVLDCLPIKFYANNMEKICSMRSYLFIQNNMDKPYKETAKLLMNFLNNMK